MNKLNKLFAILFAVLGVGTLSAQTDVTSTYLTNAGFDDNTSFVTNGICTYAKDCSANGTTLSGMQSVNGWTFGVANGDALASGVYAWGSTYFLGGSGYTIPTTDESGNTTGGALGICAVWNAPLYYYQDVTLPSGVYEFTYSVYNSGTGANAVDANLFGFVADNGSSYYGATKTFAANNWKTETVTFALTAETRGKISVGIDAADAGSGSSHHLFVDYVKLVYKPFVDVTPENSVDFTSMVSNAQSAWTGATECPNYDGISMPAVYKSSDWTGDALSQTINGLPVGKYKMEAYCQAHSSWDADAAAEGATGYTYLCANEYKLDVPIRNADGAGTKLLHTFEDIAITSGTLKISVVNEKLAANWLQIYVKSLTFLGPDKTLYEETFNTKYASLSALDTEAVPTAFANKIADLETQYDVEATALTLGQLEEANAAMDELLNSYEGVAAAYADMKSLITLCETYVAESYSIVETDGVRTTFTTAIATAKTDADAATSVSELNTAYNTLESARQAYAIAAIPTAGNSFDMTFKITNPSFETGDVTGWTVIYSSDTGVKPNSNGTYATNGVDGNYLFNTYWKGTPLTQALSSMPNGIYELKVLVASDGCTVYLTADDEHNEGTNTTDKTLFLEATMTFTCVDGNVVIGVVGGADGNAADHKEFITEGYWWYKADNFRLTRSFDVAGIQSAVANLKSEAQAIATASEPMDAAVEAALNSTIEATDATSTDLVTLDNMINALNTAIADAEASIADYVKLQKYIDMTAVFTDVTAYQAKYDNGQYSSEDVETVRRELNVARFNAASAVFTNNIEVTGWTGTMGDKTTSGQHWDGTSTTTYYDNNSWNGTAHSTATSIKLPEGSYVLKAALRSNANTTLKLTVLENVVDVEGKGDQGYGIDINGNATFAEEATYANEDKGRGWEWEFVKFELDEETEVALTVECDYNDVYGWASFSDITLWMDDATYVTVYGKELDAPLAEAKALVNTKPMGTAENTALANAIAQGEGIISTPAELNAAVDALNTAVTNANTWLTNYNEAKAPLVAALERFETDYNNAENGAIDYMNKSRWATAIEKAQAAAVAKDATDSYADFADATAALVAALDAATVSINEYAALQSAITEATVVRESQVNWGDAPFQRPESAREGLNTAISDAQSGYDNAEVDGEQVTALIDAMVVTLNVPQDAYCITVETDGHAYVDCPVVASLGNTGDNNPTGYGFAAKKENEDLLAQLYTFTQVDGNKYRISVTVEGETVYLTYGELNGSAAGWKQEQIQGNTDISKAGEFEVVASTTTEGVFRLRNTLTGTFLDCQDGGAIYTDGNITKDEFALTSATASTAINISAEAQLGTCVLMFDAQLPDGLTAYVPESYDDETTVLTLKMVTDGVLPAYTPCLLYAEGGYEGTLTGTVTMNGYAGKVTGDDGLLYGAIEAQTITEGYILQKQEGTEVAKFYNVDGEEVPIPAGKCWLTLANGVEGTIETPAAVAFFFRGGGATKLNAVVMDKATTLDGAIYTLDGKRVNTMQRGEIYIINGQKVMVK